MDLISIIVGSSTPDGLAPLSKTGIVVFIFTLTGLPLVFLIALIVMFQLMFTG